MGPKRNGSDAESFPGKSDAWGHSACALSADEPQCLRARSLRACLRA